MAKHEMYLAVKIGAYKISLMYPLAARKPPQDLYVKVFTLYEMLRIADIIEDSNTDRKEELLNLHSESLFKEEFSKEVDNFVKKNASTKQEKAAADYYFLFFGEFIRLSDETKKIIASTNKGVMPGMINNSYNDIKSWDQQHEYAGYVAGEVGAGLTKLFAQHIDTDNLESFVKKGYRQGIALQKINILRDLREDISNGRNYIPEELLDMNHLKRKDLFTVHRMDEDELFRNNDNKILQRQNQVIKTLALNAQYFLEDGLKYVMHIPLYEKKSPKHEYSRGIRIFSTALLLGGQEIIYNIYNNPSLVEKSYRPKSVLMKCGISAPMIWDDDKTIRQQFYSKKIREKI